MYHLWTSGQSWEYSHGSLAFLVALYIFGKYWLSQSQTLSYKIDVFGVVLLLGAIAAWLLAELGSIQVLQQLTLLAIVSLLFWGLFGFRVFLHLILPLLIVLSAIPMWGFLEYYLQYITTVGVSFLLSFTSIPFVREGFEIQLYSGTFLVEDVCSGLRMLTAMTPVALLYIHLNKIRWRMGIVYVGLALFAAMIANIIRILIVVIAGHMTDMKHYFVTTDHVTLGWVVFGIVVFAFIYLSNRILLSDKLYPYVVTQSGGDNNSEPQSIYVSKQSSAKIISTVIFFALVLSSGPAMTKVFSYSSKLDKTIELASSFGEWEKVNAKQEALQPVYRGSDLELNALYLNRADEEVQLYLAVYKEQRQGKEAIHYQNRPFDAEKFKLTGQSQVSSKIANLGEFAVKEYKIRPAYGRQKLIWQWYYTNGARTNNDTKAKLLGIKGRVLGDPIFSVLVLSTDIDGEYQSAVNRLESMLSESLGDIEKNLDSLS